jgi:sigma-B regulation protein RsbU (phosphoserine phosphatase)
MARLRLPEWVSAGRREAPVLSAPVDAAPPRTARDLLLRSWPGRLFLASAALRLLAALLRPTGMLPQVVSLVATLAVLGLIASLLYFVSRLFVLAQRRLLWRVRRKLIISYIFMGVVPAMLIIGFFLLGAGVVSMNVSAYLFKDGYDAMIDDIALIAQATATEVAREPQNIEGILSRNQYNVRQRYPEISLAFIPSARSKAEPARVGPWAHGEPPKSIPAWAELDGFKGTVAIPIENTSHEVHLVIRSVRPARGPAPGGHVGAVVVDLFVDDQALAALHERTGVKGTNSYLSAGEQDTSAAAAAAKAATTDGSAFSLFRDSVTFLDCTLWSDDGERRDCQTSIGITYRLGELWGRLTGAQAIRVEGQSFGQLLMAFLVFLSVLFLIIQGVALLMGLTLARSITSAIHELFAGTERVRHGDFTHRINVTSNDQLGELAQSFNQMTGSIEGLLQTAAEKKRLEEELRIARQIQMSLLPRGPLDLPGLGVTALCVPAREVGGDYYDFFHLPDERLGILIADVAGKGTSAALYMAELKGLVLALSQSHQSPRQLLIEVNRIISDNLDSRSFITMTYGVIDRRAGVMTYCRAGHTPLIYRSSDSDSEAQVLTPSGLVVGLRIPGAAEKFSDLLDEQRIDLTVGDVISLYTDGITEAMNPAGELFGDARLSRIIGEHGHLSAGELRERILREIEAFVGGADQHDDMTMILVKIEHAFARVAAGAGRR